MKSRKFEVSSGKPLQHRPTSIKVPFKDDKEAQGLLMEYQSQLSHQQELLSAQNQWSVLLILQGMDTAGKDGIVKHVLSGVNPQGCSSSSFKRPSPLELDHDFLWRYQTLLPQRGQIGIFNRSYYEDLIVPEVHPEIFQASQIPPSLINLKTVFKDRAQDVTHFEAYLARQGFCIIKLFLHLSKSEQRKRLIERIDNPAKNWKFEDSDMKEREYWRAYQKAYAHVLKRTSHKVAPWYVIPADDKMTARLIASQIIIDRMQELDLKFPKTTSERKSKLQKYRQALKNG